MKKTTNVWQRGTACGLGGFIGIFISRQFSNDWLWTSVGLILGLFVGWMVAMFADNPKPFMHAVKDAFAEARKVMTIGNYHEAKPRITFIFWLAMGMLAMQGTSYCLVAIVVETPSFLAIISSITLAIIVSVLVGLGVTGRLSPLPMKTLPI